MKTCPKCGGERFDNYPLCPNCMSERKSGVTMSGCLVSTGIIVAIVVGISAFATCSFRPSGAKESPALASKVESALASAGLSAGIHSVEAYDDGKVYITLAATIDAIGGAAVAEDAASGIIAICAQSVPEATDVSVFDSNMEPVQ